MATFGAIIRKAIASDVKAIVGRVNDGGPAGKPAAEECGSKQIHRLGFIIFERAER